MPCPPSSSRKSLFSLTELGQMNGCVAGGGVAAGGGPGGGSGGGGVGGGSSKDDREMPAKHEIGEELIWTGRCPPQAWHPVAVSPSHPPCRNLPHPSLQRPLFTMRSGHCTLSFLIPSKPLLDPAEGFPQERTRETQHRNRGTHTFLRCSCDLC